MSNKEQIKRVIKPYTELTGDYKEFRNGLIQSKISQFPIITSEPGYTAGKPDHFGYNVVGDIFLAFAHWILCEAKKNNIKRIAFLARDGEIIKKVFDKINTTDIESTYLLASRRCVRVSSMFTYDDVLSEVKDFIKSLNNNNKDIFRFLSLRFGISVELINNIIGKDYQYDFLRLDILEDKLHNDDFIDAVLANAKNERSNYLSYLNDHKIDSNTAFVDIGHNGSLQASICKLLNLDKSLGLYFATYDGVVDTLGSVPGSHIGLGYYRDKISTKERSDNYIKYALMIETLFLNDKGTFIKFIMDDGELIPKYLSVKNESKRVSFINTMQGGILKYVDDIKMTLGCLNIDLCNNTDFSKSFDPCERFFEIMRKPTLRDAKMFSGVTMENFFSGRDIRYITPEYNRLNVVCLWAEGTRRIKEHVAKEKENGKRDSSKNIVSKRRKSGLIKRHLAKATLRVTEHVYLMMSPFVNKRKVNKFKLDRELFYKDTKNRIIRNIWMSSK